MCRLKRILAVRRPGRAAAAGVLAAGWLAVAGCGGIETADPDAGDGPGVDAAADAAVPPDAATEVSGRMTRRWITDGGVVVRPAPVEGIFAFDAEGVRYEGTTHADGTYVVPGVPMGPYTLCVPFDEVTNLCWGVEDRRWIEFEETALGSPDRPSELATISPTMLYLDIENAGTGSVEVRTPARSFSFPDTGAPVFSEAIDWSTGDWEQGPLPLIDARWGDELLVLQQEQRETDGISFSAYARGFLAAPFTQENGQPAVVSGSFDILPEVDLELSWNGLEFAALRGASLPPGVEPDFASTSISVLSRPALFTEHVLPGGYAMGSVGDAPAADATLSLRLGDPYGPGATPLVSVMTFALTQELVLTAFQLLTLPLADLPDGVVRPQLGHVRNPRINGADALVPRSGVGLTPTLSWDPPDLGTPTYYAAMLLSEGKSWLLYTQGTSVTVPPGVLTAGTQYAFSLRSYWRPASEYPGKITGGAGDALVGRLTALMTP
jgi:hypothetical protein